MSGTVEVGACWVRVTEGGGGGSEAEVDVGCGGVGRVWEGIKVGDGRLWGMFGAAIGE